MNANDKNPPEPFGDEPRSTGGPKSGILRATAIVAGNLYNEGKRILLLITVLTVAVAVIGLVYLVYDRKDSVRNLSLDSNGLKVDFADKSAEPKATPPEPKATPVAVAVAVAPIAPPVIPTTPPVAPPAVSTTVPVILVLDRSLGWAAPEAFAIVRNAVSEFVGGLPADVPVEVMSLNSNLVWMPSANRKDLVKRIDAQFPMGRQDLREGIRAAFAKATDGTRIIVVTSGRELTGRTPAADLSKIATEGTKRVRLDVVVCGTVPEELVAELKGLSGRTGGGVRACRLEEVADRLAGLMK